ncbi:MAG: amidophosphoribosyltransferase [Gemmatimonadota bacterium]|nr:MAG: amidophosphoribosyltransferase [Gemmatimonadota bacterium]
MCGVIGVAGLKNAAGLAYLSLYALQHRGQESAGMVAIDSAGTARGHRGMGLVPEVFTQRVLSELPGDIAIGHTRYSTAGSSALLNAQPSLVHYHAGPLALSHNGNLTNAEELRDDLVRRGSIFQSSADSEVLVHLIARSDRQSPEEQILDALERVEGAYTLILAVGRTMYGIVDPRGFRPLVLAELNGGWMLASETCALDIVGARVVREFGPGEWIKIEDGMVVDLPPLPKKEPQRCVFELIYFSRPDSIVFGTSVDLARRELGRQLAREHPVPNADCVFSVPDSANAMALGFAEESGVKLEHGLIRNHYVGRTFINPGQASRTEKVRIKFNPVREVIQDQSIVVIDDSLVRGTTSKALVRMIREAGAREVHMRLASPPITGPCYYGIDTPTHEELIAASLSVEEIRRELAVDTLGYLSLGGMLTAAGKEEGRFCHACFSGKYPTEIPQASAGKPNHRNDVLMVEADLIHSNQ